MGRLIDADALIEALKNEPSYSIELPANIGDSIQKLLAVHQKMVVDVVKKQPTAYDVDAVVEQLMILHEEGYCPNEEDDDDDCVLSKTCSDCYRDKLTEIVRKGGIDGKEEKQA